MCDREDLVPYSRCTVCANNHRNIIINWIGRKYQRKNFHLIFHAKWLLKERVGEKSTKNFSRYWNEILPNDKRMRHRRLTHVLTMNTGAVNEQNRNTYSRESAYYCLSTSRKIILYRIMLRSRNTYYVSKLKNKNAFLFSFFFCVWYTFIIIIREVRWHVCRMRIKMHACTVNSQFEFAFWIDFAWR